MFNRKFTAATEYWAYAAPYNVPLAWEPAIVAVLPITGLEVVDDKEDTLAVKAMNFLDKLGGELPYTLVQE